MEKPLVSVIVPTFNGLSRGYLKEALKSVLVQSYNRLELIVVDDGSVDDIKDGCVELFVDKRARMVRQDNQGLSAARKKGIEEAHGKYIALLDDDDRWAVHKLGLQVEFFERHADPLIGMVFTGVRLIDAKGRVVGARRHVASGDIYRELLSRGNLITAPSTVMIKRDVIDAVGNFDPAMRSLEDLDLWMRVARKYHIYSMSPLLADYRLHDNTITARSFSREEEFEKRLYEKVLAKEQGIDEELVYHKMYERFAIRHFSLGNYREARIRLAKSMRCHISLKSVFLWLTTFVPSPLLELMKNARRLLKYMMLKS